MLKLDKASAIKHLNLAGEQAQSFFILADFLGENFQFWTLEELAQQNILIDFPNYKNFSPINNLQTSTKIELLEILTTKKYRQAFTKVQEAIQQGDTYLCNLTFAQKIKLQTELKNIFFLANARFKIYYPQNFLCFSPEIFISTKDNKISTFPMKGTFSSAEPEKIQTIKEIAEHATVVDLLRNDLSLVATEVKVENYRYLEEITTATGDKYLQSSSKISGLLPTAWQKNLGDIFIKLLPAGSVTGAPKRKTLEIISEVENHQRNFYTGVAAFFDGQDLTSCVLIRFIEESSEGYFFKSGGGITTESDWQAEYQELISKIYVPIS